MSRFGDDHTHPWDAEDFCRTCGKDHNACTCEVTACGHCNQQMDQMDFFPFCSAACERAAEIYVAGLEDPRRV